MFIETPNDLICDFLPGLKTRDSYFIYRLILLPYLDRLFPSVRGCESGFMIAFYDILSIAKKDVIEQNASS